MPNGDSILVMSAAMSARMATPTISGKRMFAPSFVRSIAHVASPIARLIPMEVVEPLRPVIRQWSVVTVPRIKPVVHVSVEVPMAVKPWACSKKHAAHKPIGPIVAVRRAVVRSVVEVSVRTHRSRPDVYANRDLSWCHRCGA